MKIITLLLALSLFCCKQVEINESKNIEKQEIAQISAEKTALAFINNYVNYWNENDQEVSLTDWISTQKNATENYKIQVVKLIADADRADLEFDLIEDPIFKAQDYPEKGFELEKSEQNGTLITVKGKGWEDYKLKISMVRENGNWMVADVQTAIKND